ncbi:MAG: hypothetical protein RJA70_1475 [Pseudomonadota bacterium]|jgi:Zn-dependent protease
MGVLRFRLFGFPVRIEPSYWFMTLLIAWGMSDKAIGMAAAMAGILFASILVHELGHALAARSFGLSPQISLHMMGGTTAFAPTAQLSRGRDILVSLAGPFAGFSLGLLAWLLLMIYAPSSAGRAEGYQPSPLVVGLRAAAWLNLVWGVLNLLPVIPLDGGLVLAAALGPARRQLAAVVSLLAGLGAALILVKFGSPIGAVFIAMFGVTSYFRSQQPEVQAPNVSDVSLNQALIAAKRALDKAEFAQASLLARGVLGAAQDAKLASRALDVLIWSLLGLGDTKAAREVLVSAPQGMIDPYTEGATHEASGALDDARRVLSQARALGDSRVELTALLVKVLLAQEKYSAAANVTREIVDRISAEDVRRVVSEAEAGGAVTEAARLSLALARTERSFRDACAAVLGFAQAGAQEDLIEAFKLARSFDSAASRALLADERLNTSRSVLESV